jgi:hypothetical protein
MAQIRIVSLPWTTLIADSVNEAFFPISSYIDAGQVDGVRSTFEVAFASQDFQVAAGYQTANDADNPDTPVAFGDFASTVGFEYPSAWVDLATDVTNDKQMIRFGFVVKLADATPGTPAFGRVSGNVEAQV